MPSRVLFVLALACVAVSADGAFGVTVKGIVLGTDGARIRFANVVILGTRRGAQTDTTGTFTISGVEPGTYKFRAIALGLQPVTRSFTISAGANEPCTLTVDTRTGIGLGRGIREPFTPIPDSLWKSLGRVVSGQTFRLNPQGDWSDPRRSNSESSIGPYEIVERGRKFSRSEAARIGEVLRDENSYWHPLVGEKKLCETVYRHGLRLETDEGDTIDCAICLSCSALTLRLRQGEISWGHDFVSQEVKHWFDKAFHDPDVEESPSR